ncbi:MAG: succinyl-diaminopimelate desuccinylase [Pseudomonadales bacterium]|nr:succinyl-diaminopimelate desuccinylase [Pseudomonadales bacterium]
MEVTNRVLDLTCALIRARSVTPEDAGCQQLIADRLSAIGFRIEFLNASDVTNLWATRQFGSGEGPHLLFAGHTDVVPTGPVEQWSSDPFEPLVSDGKLQGRGAADMKSSLAAMVVAMERLEGNEGADAMDEVRINPPPLPPPLNGTVSFLITSDEEGPAIHGTRHVIDVLNDRGVVPTYCVVGEPSSSHQVGDVVRCGRRGSLNGRLRIRGIQGHVAYPEDVLNPIHTAMPALADLAQTVWDNGNEYYPPTSFQISNIHAGTGASNVVPGEAEVLFNFRFNTEQTEERLKAKVHAILESHTTEFDIEWTLSGPPFLTRQGKLTEAVTHSIQEITNQTTELSTSGGTSDGRFISHWNQPGSNRVEVVELGPTNATIHKIDEQIGVGELSPLTQIYQHIAQKLLSQ